MPALAPVAWVAFIPLLVALERRLDSGGSLRGAFSLGWLCGFAFYAIGAYWLVLLSDVAITVPWLKYPGWVLCAAYLALYPAFASWLAAWVSRRSGRSLAATVPFAWLALETVRASGDLGFPWFQPGYSQHRLLPLIQMASLGGITLVTLWLLLLNVLIWRAFMPSGIGGARLRPALGALFMVVLPWAWGSAVLRAAPPVPAGAPLIALVQPNIPGEMKWDGRHQDQVLAMVMAPSESAARHVPKPSLIVWPETATGTYLTKQLDQTLQVYRLAASTGVPVFSGFPDYRIDAHGQTLYENTAGLFRPDGVRNETYAKIHLVPFGERMPFEGMFPALKRVQLGQAEWSPGDRWVLFPSGSSTFGCMICFESIYPDHARTLVKRGAGWLMVITNDEWFGDSAALQQHAAMAIVRAVENHVPLARCANTGVTMMVDAFGRITARARPWTATTVIAPLPARGRPTPYTRLGDWPGWLAWGALAMMSIMAPRGRARARSASR